MHTDTSYKLSSCECMHKLVNIKKEQFDQQEKRKKEQEKVYCNMSCAVIEKDTPKMKVHSWENKFIDTSIYFQIVYMEFDVCWIWIGSQPIFNTLSISMNTNYV